MKDFNEQLSELSLSDLLALSTLRVEHKPCRYDLLKSDMSRRVLDGLPAGGGGGGLAEIFSEIFRLDRQPEVVSEVDRLLDDLSKSVSSEQSIFDDLEYLQILASSALWKYQIELCPELERFARDFDRIDDWRERARILQIQRK